MPDMKIWFVTGAGRGMGTSIAKAALNAGHAVVATGRKTDTVKAAIGDADDLLVVKLDITSPDLRVVDTCNRAICSLWILSTKGRDFLDY